MSSYSLGSLLLSSVMLAGNANALDLGQPLSEDESRWSVGIQSSFISGGISAKYRYTDIVTIQGTLGALGTVQNYGLRGLYTVKQEDSLNIYGFGGVGLWKWSGSGSFGSETVLGLSGGVGAAYTFPDLPLELSAELGLGLVNFDHYSFSSVGIGLGAHYSF